MHNNTRGNYLLVLLLLFWQLSPTASSKELSPSLRRAEYLYDSGSLSSARKIALNVNKLFPNNFQAILILVKIDFENENYKSAKKWLRKAYLLHRSHPLVKLYTSLLNEVEHRFGDIPSEVSILNSKKTEMKSAKDFKRAWFGPNFPVLSKPSVSHRVEKESVAIAIPLPSDKATPGPTEKTVLDIANKAFAQTRYLKAYLFFTQLLESKPKNRKYRIGKAKSAFHMKRYREAVTLLGPYVSLAPKSFSAKQLKTAKSLLSQSRKHVYTKTN